MLVVDAALFLGPFIFFPKLWASWMKGLSDYMGFAARYVNVVREMRVVPMSTRMVTEFVLAVLIPVLPLLLFKYSFAELAPKFFARLSGL
jgi:hypothetical protein